MSDQLQIGARVCQRCGQPFALVAPSTDTALVAHLPALRALAAQSGAVGYLVLERSGPTGVARVLRVEGAEEPRWLTPEEYGEDQEAAFLRHRCPAKESNA